MTRWSLRPPGFGRAMAAVVMVSCVQSNEPLPPVTVHMRIAEPPQPCAAPPVIRPELRPLLDSPDDPNRCFDPSSFRRMVASAGPWGMPERRSLPVQLAVESDGRVSALGFNDQCAGVEFEVDPRVLACLEEVFSSWRFAADVEGCPGTYYMQELWHNLTIAPRDGGELAVRTGGESGCDG